MPRRTHETTKLDKYIGERIGEVRLSKGISRQQLAAQLFITHQQLQKYEKGTNRVSATRLSQIAEILGKPMEYFMIINEIPVATNNRTRIILELQREFIKMPPEIQNVFVHLARVINKGE